jgi:hypothetical protein
MDTLLARCLASWLALLPTALMAQGRTGHDAFHEFYQGLKSPEGESCCNEKDCHPVEGRFVPQGRGFTLEILIKRWVKVPRDRILPQPSPDGGVHLLQRPGPLYDRNEAQPSHSLCHCRRHRMAEAKKGAC